MFSCVDHFFWTAAWWRLDPCVLTTGHLPGERLSLYTPASFTPFRHICIGHLTYKSQGILGWTTTSVFIKTSSLGALQAKAKETLLPMRFSELLFFSTIIVCFVFSLHILSCNYFLLFFSFLFLFCFVFYLFFFVCLFVCFVFYLFFIFLFFSIFFSCFGFIFSFYFWLSNSFSHMKRLALINCCACLFFCFVFWAEIVE